MRSPCITDKNGLNTKYSIKESIKVHPFLLSTTTVSRYHHPHQIRHYMCI
jgi:hypothetical protein